MGMAMGMAMAMVMVMEIVYITEARLIVLGLKIDLKLHRFFDRNKRVIKTGIVLVLHVIEDKERQYYSQQ